MSAMPEGIPHPYTEDPCLFLDSASVVSEEAIENSPVKLYADILGDGESLIGALKNNRYPDEAEEVYEFLPGHDQLTYLPTVVRDYLMTRELQATRLTLGHAEKVKSLALEFEADDGTMLYISRSSELEDQLDAPFDALISQDSDTITPVTKTPMVEINRFIFSLIAPSKTGDYSHADSMDILGSDNAFMEEIMGQLKDTAPSYSTRNTYLLTEPHQNSSVFYREDNGHLTELTIKHALNSRKEIIASIDCTNAMDIRFWSRQIDEDISEPLLPDTGDLQVVQQFVGEALQIAAPPVETSLDTAEWEMNFFRERGDLDFADWHSLD